MTQPNKAKEIKFPDGYRIKLMSLELHKKLLAELQKQHEEEMSRILFGNECFDICPEIQKLKARIKEMEK